MPPSTDDGSNSMIDSEHPLCRVAPTSPSVLQRQAINHKSFFRHFIRLPELPKDKFVVAPDTPLPAYIVEDEYAKLWRGEDIEALELGCDEEQINKGIPSMAMAKLAAANMRWEKLIQMGACSATYATDKYVLQLTNSTIIAVLLSGFATAALVQPPNFQISDRLPAPWPAICQSCYTLSMVSSAISCFAATGIALHSVNRLSNVCPSKSSVAYMTYNIFHSARDAVESYVFRGMASACGGIVVAVTWNTANILYGVPALIFGLTGSIWFIIMYKQWDRMAKFHSDVADKLCAKDFMVAAENNNSITEGLWRS